MTKYFLLLAAAPLALIAPAHARDADTAEPAAAQNAPEARKEVFSTGVAKGRDRLDQATSTSAIRGEEVHKLEPSSVAQIVRNIPGIRVEASSGVANNSYTIRGLPLASIGSKYLQFQEDGLPILEFGDFSFLGTDMFLRVDSSLNAVEAIRGGSSSTFASNAPGGVINFITKTGETEGGAVQATTGIGEEMYRADFTYGGRLSDTLRYQVGGFYREGEGPRATGYTGYRGGQIKANITKELPNGYVRLHAKYLDDRVPTYYFAPLRVTGTNDKPNYENVANFDISKDSMLSAYIPTQVTRDGNNAVRAFDMKDGLNPVVKAIGLESQFDIAGWTITERFRFADISGQMLQNFPLTVAPAAALAQSLGGPGATLSYASGPNTGQAIATPSALNGNGLLAASLLMNIQINSLDNMTNDLRASRVWDLSGGKLTFTAGYYKSRQWMNTDWLFTSVISDVRGNGEASLINVTTAGGVPQTQNGVFAYSAALVTTGYRRKYDVEFDTSAPYGSLNFHIGKVAIGASVRFNSGKAQGSIYGGELGGGRTPIAPFDINGDGVISAPETRSGIIPLTTPAPVDFDYNFVSYSAGVNYRVAEEMALFARYSKGGRAAATGPLFNPGHNSVTGGLVDQADAYDLVKQAEGGVKFRKANLTLNLTGFWASTDERNMQINTSAGGVTQVERIYRTYEAYGLEFEGAYQYGPFSVTAGATWTKAEIAKDQFNAAAVGNTPRHQPDLIYQTTAQYESKRFTVGANVVGTTGSFAQDSNQLRLPGYTLVNGFAQVRLTDNVQLGVTANNLFDTLALTDVNQPAIPASGVVTARALNGRTVAGSVRFSF
ncbi:MULTISPECIES: TonB-dependent receptor [unclassified Sphingomonas]|uniref:TonB-dependent receptor n=1 Tax=unclassified Sphingomonas TaxID=196159 RepID=UPI002150809C|nr:MULTISPECIES: TonB-dependent receptor [unclassified Sphingomonas]MCR5870088.1 TonB-dependent receptor [Sphingomonas sp. J344]UUX98223.1 TonB-dependent receptor [Sphingomonas sp. J315]